MKRIALLSLIFSSLIVSLASAQHTLLSPNGQLEARLRDGGGRLQLSVSDQGRLLTEVHLGIEAEVDGRQVTSQALKGKAKVQHHGEHIAAPNYRQAEFRAEWNQLTLRLNDGLALEIRAFDEGVAYRFLLPKAKQPVATKVKAETVEYAFPGDPVCYLAHSTNPKKPEAMAFQATYDAKPLSEQPDLLAFLPATVVCNGAKVTLMESDVVGYPGMFVAPHGGNEELRMKNEELKIENARLSFALRASFSHYPKTFDYYAWRKQKYVTGTEDYIAKEVSQTPWRIIAIAHSDKDMPTNNMVYALASPSRIADTSWIRPGHVAWDWWNDWGVSGVPFKAGINNETYKHYIDFAAKYGLEYVILDEGWYNPKSGDMLTTIPDIDLPLLTAYAREHNVRLILWTVFNVLDAQLEAACEKYARMGIAGFKVDFLDRNDQEAVDMTYRIAEACARHHLVLDYHGIYAPQGIQRTWPNVVNFEAVFGMEEVKWTKHDEKDMPQYDVTFPFIRGQAGYVDFTPGGMRNATRADFQPINNNPLTMGTRCHQLAHYIVHESPLTMLADNPTIYEQEQECTRFIASLPTAYQSLSVLDGQMGEYIVVLRTDKQGNYYVGGETNWQGRKVEIDFGTFLPEGEYEYTLFCDGLNADHVATDYRTEKGSAQKGQRKEITLASGGGFAMKIKRVKD